MALTDSEQAYWLRAQEQRAEADLLEAEAAAMEQRASMYRIRATQMRAAYESYEAYLFERHGLDDKTDRLRPDGSIRRSDGNVTPAHPTE